MNDHSFDDLIKQKATAHEAPVPAGAWEAIAQKKEKKRPLFVFWWIAGMGVALATGAAALYLNRSYKTTSSVAVLKTGAGNKPVESAIGRFSDKQRDHRNTILYTDTISALKAGATDSLNISDCQTAISPNKTPSLTVGIKVNRAARKTSLLTTDNVFPPVIQSAAWNPVEFVKDISAANDPAGSTDLTSSPMEASIVSGNINKLNKGVVTVAGIPDLPVIKYKRAKRFNWAIEISATPFMPVQHNESLLYITRNISDDMLKSVYRSDKATTHLEPSVSYAVSLRKKIRRNLQIAAGVQYTVIKERVDLTGAETNTSYTAVQRLINGGNGPELINDTVETVTSGTRTIHALNSYSLLTMPVSVHYTLMKKASWSLQLQGGLLLNLSSRYHNSIRKEPVTVYAAGVKEARQKKAIVNDLFAGLRLSKSYGHYQLFAEPVIRYNIRRYDMDNMINRKLIHQAGLSIGAALQFGK